MHSPAKVFLAYAHLDAKFRFELEDQLKLLSRKRQMSWWSEHELVPGENRIEAIGNALNEADIILLLISIHFLANDFCWSEQLQRAIDRHDRGEALVIPIFVRPCVWEETPVERLQGLPRDGRPVASWTDRHEAWADVARGIQRAFDGWRERDS